MENWYCKLHLVHPVQSKVNLKSMEILWSSRFWMGPTLALVNQMKLAIPVFHVEFDPLQLSFTGLSKIPPFGDCGDFWWLLWRLFWRLFKKDTSWHFKIRPISLWNMFESDSSWKITGDIFSRWPTAEDQGETYKLMNEMIMTLDQLVVQNKSNVHNEK